MATLEARRNRQVLLKLPADEREDTGLLPFNTVGPWELLPILGGSVIARASSEPEEHFLPLKIPSPILSASNSCVDLTPGKVC